jgi:hypothetical protein
MPSDYLAGNEKSGAFDGGCSLCGGELRQLPHYRRLGWGIVRPQHYRICTGGHALHHAVRFLPYE